ncbi:MAG: response regulator [Candidatus Hydrogenedentes bacterium]|nr:response regulator [Candidatus Hydrogenedentota bacterium]
MESQTRILQVEDLATDAELARREILKSLKGCTFFRVEERDEMLGALEDFKPDIIIADYRMPRFDGMSALNLALEHVPDTPVIILTTAMNEDIAVECMKAGATDYVIKEHIKRLGQAVLHALEQKEIRLHRRYALEALRRNEEHLRTLYENVPIGLCRVSLDGRILMANPTAVHMLNYATQDLPGNTPPEAELLAPTYLRDEFREKVGKEGVVTGIESAWTRRDGATIYVRESATLVCDALGDPRYYDGIIEDVTDQKLAEAALQESQERLAELADNVDSVLIVLEIKSDRSYLSYLSAAFDRVWDRPREEVFNEPFSWLDTIHPDDRNRVKAAVVESLSSSGARSELEYRIIRPDGSVRWIRHRVYPLYSEQAHAMRIVGVADDITERKNAEADREVLEAQLRQAQKLESVGRLAGGVAHDFNNMLTVILGYVDLIKADTPNDHPFMEGMLEIEKAARRAKDTTKQLLAFSRKQVIVPQPINLSAHISDTQRTLARLIGEDVSLEFSPAAEIWSISFDPSQLDQILMNLVVNARDAMPDGGNIRIETRNVSFETLAEHSQAGLLKGDFVLLIISDDGTGMDAETLAHIFEPFYTTKEVGKGTGLGLATVYGIVEQSGGFIDVDSAPGHGTSFKIYVPRLQESPTPKSIPTVSPATPRSGTILLVEDDQMVRKMTQSMLTALGYTVVAAESPPQAIAMCEGSATRYDLLLTDVVMPEMSGLELRDRLIEIYPDLKIVFMSGYSGSSDSIIRRGAMDRSVQFLQKPFSVNDLAVRLEQALSEKVHSSRL